MSTDDRDNLGPLEPGLDQLFRVLTSAPTRDELAGEQAALTMFRSAAGDAAHGAATPTVPAPAAAPVAERASRHRTWGFRRTVVVATAAFVAGFAAAAYAAVLPAPVQHVAYKVLGFVGVPNAPAQHGHPRPAGHTAPHSPVGGGSSQPAIGPGSSSPGSTSSARPSHSPSPHPSKSKTVGPPAPPQLSVTASQPQIPAGTSATITATATRHGHGAAGVSVTLLERTPRHRAWTAVAQGTTGRGGQAKLTVSDLTMNAGFRVTGPGGSTSAAIRVKVVPEVSVTVLTRPSGRRAVIKVVCQYAQPGNVVVLEVYRDGTWVRVRVRRIGPLLKTGFLVKVPLAKAKTVQVLLRATRLHAAAISNEVAVGPRV
jgi:hypothetical protein